MYGVKRCLKFIQSLDTSDSDSGNDSGNISWKTLSTLLCLLDAPVPNQAEILKYAEDLQNRSENGYIEQEAFARVFE